MGRTACHMLNFLGLGMNMTESSTFPILLLLTQVGPCFLRLVLLLLPQLVLTNTLATAVTLLLLLLCYYRWYEYY